jgi:hypothetical protein
LTYQRVEDKRPKEGKDLELICSFSIWSLLALADLLLSSCPHKCKSQHHLSPIQERHVSAIPLCFYQCITLLEKGEGIMTSASLKHKLWNDMDNCNLVTYFNSDKICSCGGTIGIIYFGYKYDFLPK